MRAGWRRRLAVRPWPAWLATGSPLTPWSSRRSHGSAGPCPSRATGTTPRRSGDQGLVTMSLSLMLIRPLPAQYCSLLAVSGFGRSRTLTPCREGLDRYCPLGAIPPVGIWRQASAGRMQKLWRSCADSSLSTSQANHGWQYRNLVTAPEAGPGCQLSCALRRAGWTPSTTTSPRRCAGGPRCRAEQRRCNRERQAPTPRESCRCRLSQSSSQFGQRRSGARLPCDQHSRHHPSAVRGHVAVSTGVGPGADDPAGAYCAAGCTCAPG